MNGFFTCLFLIFLGFLVVGFKWSFDDNYEKRYYKAFTRNHCSEMQYEPQKCKYEFDKIFNRDSWKQQIYYKNEAEILKTYAN